jgi:hypothetical protein
MKRDGFNHTCEAVAYTWFNRKQRGPPVAYFPATGLYLIALSTLKDYKTTVTVFEGGNNEQSSKWRCRYFPVGYKLPGPADTAGIFLRLRTNL